MRRWVGDQLPAPATRPVLIIDRFGVILDDELASGRDSQPEVFRCGDWFALRKAWEHQGRYAPDPAAVVFVVTDAEVAQSGDLPFDIEHGTSVVVLRVPGGPDVRAAIVALDAESSDRAVATISAGGHTDAAAVLTAAAEVSPTQLDEGAGPGEFRVAVRLRSTPVPPAVLDLARRTLTDVLAAAILHEPPETPVVQAAWQAWLDEGASSRWSRHFDAAAAEVTNLFFDAVLAPARSDRHDLPRWAAIGIATSSPADRARTLLETVPEVAATSTFAEWVAAAQWWGQIRNSLALTNPCPAELHETAWAAWAELHAPFQVWLRGHFGAQLTRSWVNGPVSLDKVQPYLARRHSEIGRVLLIVLDGLGFAQWSRIVERARIDVVHGGGVLAMVPTLTTVSRQAIAAGALPNQFAGSLGTTSKEPQRWATAWAEGDARAAWLRIDGAAVAELDQVPFADADAIGLVISATDELMHSAELLGDVGLHAGLDAWIGTGVLDTLVHRAIAAGFEVWATADHGNLEVTPESSAREGAFVESAGTRVRRYATSTLRDGSGVIGDRWDDIPGLPADEARRLLFAPGRTGWGPARVSHGGLSLDEVIVPFAQVTDR